jgi:formylmethanofuran dehydrogenase subunit D
MTNIATMKKDIVSPSGQVISIDKPEEKQELKSTQLPEVKGYRILCAVPQADEKYENGIIKADKVRNIEEHSTVVLFVVKVGDLAYKDEVRFPTGPWCKEGDFVLREHTQALDLKFTEENSALLTTIPLRGLLMILAATTRA